jgi:hypothetical protein
LCLSDLCILVVHGTDGKFVPSSVLSGDEDRDVDGGSGLISFCDRSRGETTRTTNATAEDSATNGTNTTGPAVFAVTRSRDL